MTIHIHVELPAAILNLYPELDTLDDQDHRQAVLCIYSFNRTLQSAWQSQNDLPGHWHSWLPKMLNLIETSLADLLSAPSASCLAQFLKAETTLFTENTHQARMRLDG